MGMIIGLFAVIVALVLGIVGAIVGWRMAKSKQGRVWRLLVGFLVGTLLGLIVGVGSIWLLFFFGQG